MKIVWYAGPPAQAAHAQAADRRIIDRSVSSLAFFTMFATSGWAHPVTMTINRLLSITAVHPMRKEAVEEFLKKACANWHVIEKLLIDRSRE